jgi:3'-phosphoadenosine 5'-phosphosulfate sulfotransferase (PAPS reductase)/FAD synthetase
MSDIWKVDRTRIPIVLEPDIDLPSAGLLETIDGFNTVEDILQLNPDVPSEKIMDLVSGHIDRGKMVWRDQWSPLYWCAVCDLPLLQGHCDKCGSTDNRRIELKYPCNPRPVMAHDEVLFKSTGLPWPIHPFMVINHFQRRDYVGWELIHGGRHVGDIIWEHDGQRYVFIPTAAFSKEGLVAQKDEAHRRDDLIEANSTRLARLEQEAVALIRNSCRSPLAIPVATFSGGKDSTVLIHLCSLARTKMRVWQVDTGIDPPCNLEFSKRFLSGYDGFRVHRVSSGDLFWRALEKLGPPAVDFHWCRVILKNASPFRESNTRFAGFVKYLPPFLRPRIILIDGPRRREEPRRVVLKRIAEVSRRYIRTISVRPIIDFTDLDVWMYIEWRRLPINPVYTQEKSQRMICLYCPGRSREELEAVKREYPKLWNGFERHLEEWRLRLSFPRQWTTDNLWVFNEPIPEHIQGLGIMPRIDRVRERLSRVVRMGEVEEEEAWCVRGEIREPFDLRDLGRWMRLLCRVKGMNRNRHLRIDWDGLSGQISDSGDIVLTGKGRQELERFRELLRKWIVSYMNCIGCGFCKAYSSQIRIKDDRVFVQGRRRAPTRTVEEILQNCPVNEVGVLKLLSYPTEV